MGGQHHNQGEQHAHIAQGEQHAGGQHAEREQYAQGEQHALGSNMLGEKSSITGFYIASLQEIEDNLFWLKICRVVDPYSFFTDPDPDPDPDPELDVGGQYGSGSGSEFNTDPGL